MVTITDGANVALAAAAVGSFIWAIVEKRGRSREREEAKASQQSLIDSLFRNIEQLNKDISDARAEARDATRAAGEAAATAGVAKAESASAQSQIDGLKQETAYWRGQADYWQKQAEKWQERSEHETSSNFDLRSKVDNLSAVVGRMEQPVTA